MARSATATVKPDDSGEPLASEQITYLPADGDPPSVKWLGHTFHANVPKTVTNATLIEKAKTNKFFKLGAFDPAVDGVKVEETTLPKTPEQYRAHAVAWIKRVASVDELDLKWQGEETLRMSSGAGSDDVEYLMSLLEPKRAELRKAEQAG
jgi:hypothetical protein